MPLKNPPSWWDFELELSPHVEDRMIDRGFSETDPRVMVDDAKGLRPAGTTGRWIVETSHFDDAWDVVVEPDERDRVIVVITAYKKTQ